jgi:rRNA maturation endonuclease Nob1
LDFKYVLDAGAFYAGIPFLSSSSMYFTTQAVLDEIKHIKRSYAAIEALIDSGNLQFFEPGQEETKEVIATAKKTGDTEHL